MQYVVTVQYPGWTWEPEVYGPFNSQAKAKEFADAIKDAHCRVVQLKHPAP